jgi:transmembrane sensor
MENPDQQHEQLVRYLLDELDVHQRVSVEKWIGQSDENRQYFFTLGNVVKLAAVQQNLDTIDVDKEWDYLKARLPLQNASGGFNIAEQTGEDAYETVKRQGKLRRMILAVSIAASVALLAGAGWRFFTTQKTDTPVLVKNEAPVLGPEHIGLMREETNYSAKVKTLTLEDGSVILLSPKSTVRFHEPFVNNKRDIDLSGQADFKVAKDKQRPFTVVSREISTTALGTEFRVTAYQKENSITVKLYEGKVVVKSVDGVVKKMDKEVYLLPGEQLVYNMRTHSGSVSSFEKAAGHKAEKPESAENITAGENPSVSSDNTPWYMFNNQALPVVFEQLKEMYQVDIAYTKSDLRKMYFIGKFHKTDSVETILQQIGILNKLKVTKTNNKFLVEKIKQ